MGERAFAISAGDGVSNGDEVADGYAVVVADEDGRDGSGSGICHGSSYFLLAV